MTLALSVEKASGQFLKLRVHWTKNGYNLQVSEPLKTSGSQIWSVQRFSLGWTDFELRG